ncbi:MAG: hypothetical protein K2L41_08665, partial [Muribaculaceae bacterium]|nr:hypothetical protein [Muribaculaceae bacterium]
MKFKRLLLPVMAIVPAMSFAATYYVTPDGAGSKDGSSWENAFGIGEFRDQAAKNVNGDIYNLAGGTYIMESAVVFKSGTGFTLNGGEDGSRTVFSGDINKNGKRDSEDASCLLSANSMTGHGVETNPIVINKIDFTNVFTKVNITIANDVIVENTSANGALFIDNSGSVKVNDCNFYNNWADGNRGGAAALISRSTAVFKNCVFKNNSTGHRGGAVYLMMTETNTARIKEYVTFDRCQFTNNKTNGNYGGAIFASRFSQLNIVNSTFANNSAKQYGAAIYADGKAGSTFVDMRLNIIGSTIAGNTITGENADAEIASTQGARINIVNSIVVGGNENTSAFSFSGTAENDNFSFVSGGWNYVGPVIDAVAEPAKTLGWKEGAAKNGGDQYGENCTYGTVFGDHTVGSNGVIKPFRFEYGATGAQTEAAVADWGITAVVDYNVDQLGNERIAGRMNGAFADP